MGPDLGQLLGLGAQRPGGALHFGGVVDRVLAVLVGPARLEAPPRLVECRIGLRGGAPRAVKSRGQSRNLKRATDLQCLVDRPGVPPLPRRSAQLCLCTEAAYHFRQRSPRHLPPFQTRDKPTGAVLQVNSSHWSGIGFPNSTFEFRTRSVRARMIRRGNRLLARGRPPAEVLGSADKFASVASRREHHADFAVALRSRTATSEVAHLAGEAEFRCKRYLAGYPLPFFRARNARMCCCGSPVRNARPNCSMLSSMAP